MISFESINMLDMNARDKNGLSLSFENKSINFIYKDDLHFLNNLYNTIINKNELISGSIIIDDIAINNLNISQRSKYNYNNISIFSNVESLINENVSVRKNIDFVSKVFYNLNKNQFINELLEYSGLDIYYETKVFNLTNFQKILLNIILLSLKSPKLLLINSIDTFFSTSIEIEIFGNLLLLINKKSETCILILTNNKYWLKTKFKYFDLTKPIFFKKNTNMTLFPKSNFENKDYKKISMKSKLYLLSNLFSSYKLFYISILLLSVFCFSLNIFISVSINNNANFIMDNNQIKILLIFFQSFGLVFTSIVFSCFLRKIFHDIKSKLNELQNIGLTHTFVIIIIPLFSVITSISIVILSFIIMAPIISNLLFINLSIKVWSEVIYISIGFIVALTFISLLTIIPLRIKDKK